MSKEKAANQNEEVKNQQEEVVEQAENEASNEEQSEGADTEGNGVEQELAELKDKHLRLYSEFENFRRRTSKEKLELISTATEKLMVELLPVLDDFERGLASMEKAEDVGAVKEGVQLIYDKFYRVLEGKGLKPVNAQGQEFDSELHEGVTQIPAPDESLKGKVVDEIEKGYYLGDKIIRYSKVVIGA